MSKNRKAILHYKNARAPRSLAAGDDILKIEVFSDPSVTDGETADARGVPQHPVAEHETIEVKHAADGSGMVTFFFNGRPVTGGDSAALNSMDLVFLLVSMRTTRIL